MKVKLLFAGLVLSFVAPMPQASADCAPGFGTAVEVNATTNVVTYSCVKLPEPIVRVEDPAPIAPTHTLAVQTPSQGFAVSGTPEQIANSVQTLIDKAVNIPINSCVEGGCSRVDIDVTTKQTTVVPLSKSEVRYQTDQMAQQTIKNAELAKAASQALPNIQPVNPTVKEIEPTPLVEEEPDWWADFMRALAEFYLWYNNVDWWSF